MVYSYGGYQPPVSGMTYRSSASPAVSSGDKDLDALLSKVDTVAKSTDAGLSSLSSGTSSPSRLQQSDANAAVLGSTLTTGRDANLDVILQQQTSHLMQALTTMKSQGASAVSAASTGVRSASGAYFGKASNAPASDFSSLTSEGKEMMEALNNPNVRAFLDALAIAELGKAGAEKGGYGKFYGDAGTEESFNNQQLANGHPDQVRSSGGLASSATGRYQFLTTTWNETAKQLGLKDMMPQAQEVAAVALLKKRGILNAVKAGRFEVAFNEAGKEWASLEGNPYGQGTEEGKRSTFMAHVQNGLQKYA